jgi:hypothetical protein
MAMEFPTKQAVASPSHDQAPNFREQAGASGADGAPRAVTPRVP